MIRIGLDLNWWFKWLTVNLHLCHDGLNNDYIIAQSVNLRRPLLSSFFYFFDCHLMSSCLRCLCSQAIVWKKESRIIVIKISECIDIIQMNTRTLWIWILCYWSYVIPLQKCLNVLVFLIYNRYYYHEHQHLHYGGLGYSQIAWWPSLRAKTHDMIQQHL